MYEDLDKIVDRLEGRLLDLHAKAHVKEQPFTSGAPVLGRLLVLVRETWNSVATKWYVRPMLHQQNLFNQAVLEAVQEILQAQRVLSQRLEEFDQRLVGGDQDLTLVARANAENDYRLRQLGERVKQERAALAERLSRLEALLDAQLETGIEGGER